MGIPNEDHEHREEALRKQIRNKDEMIKFYKEQETRRIEQHDIER